MQDNGFIMRWRSAAVAVAAASAACVALSACANDSRAPSKEDDAGAPPAFTEGLRAKDSTQGGESVTLNADSLEYHDARATVAPEIGWASYYGKKFQGRRTASGERYDMQALTAAHRTFPLGSYVRVSNLAKTRSVVVRINDRGPFTRGRVIDLSFAAASELGLLRAGSAQVMLEPLGRSVEQSVTQAEVSNAPERVVLHTEPRPNRHPKHARHH
ncbi:RlpA-like lipoprotein [Caballeronia hypogeia]|uniref:Endolytic peptidoglycan transglycosylase RlpA n=1 Tax=Caballeronia hypogeia TaxID=1777140 RepID=A0A158A2S1_9BURK|nr:septal ring lytic transglycosylase RlpA family protein [Caballeronia hypogeia]SAK52045.1 RlpA-like lipoprotein [Caballeronia hypogeia]